MSLSRSTFYDPPPAPVGPDELVTRIGAICDEFECYGYRRVGAALRQQGVVVNGKKLRRLMREYDLQPKRRRRYVTTTDSDHAGPHRVGLRDRALTRLMVYSFARIGAAVSMEVGSPARERRQAPCLATQSRNLPSRLHRRLQA